MLDKHGFIYQIIFYLSNAFDLVTTKDKYWQFLKDSHVTNNVNIIVMVIKIWIAMH